MCACTRSVMWLFVTPWTVAHQAPLSVGFPRQEYWSGRMVAISSSRESSQPSDRTWISCVSCNGEWILYYWSRGHKANTIQNNEWIEWVISIMKRGGYVLPWVREVIAECPTLVNSNMSVCVCVCVCVCVHMCVCVSPSVVSSSWRLSGL